MTPPPSNCLPPQGEELRRAPSLLLKEETRQDHQSDGDGSRNSRNGAENVPGTLSNKDVKNRMGIVEGMGRLAKRITYSPSKIAMNELRVRVLSTLADALESDFERLNTVESIELAVECRRRALSLTPQWHAERVHVLGTFGTALMNKFERLGDLEDVNGAIQYLSQALQLTSGMDSNHFGLLNNLATSYRYRFEHRGELADVDQAIQHQTQAVRLIPDGHPHKLGTLSNLGISYMCRSQRFGELADLDHAIRCQTQAVKLATDSHFDKPAWVCNLGNSYIRRFERLGELADLDQAIQCQTQAVQLAPRGHPYRLSILNNLGGSYLHRFRRLSELSDLDQAIQSHTQAVQLTPDDHPDKPAKLKNLGSSYRSRFQRLGEPGDMDQAIQYQTQAVQLTPDGHRDKPDHLNNLGRSYESRAKRMNHPVDHEFALSAFQQAAELPLSNPRIQLASARNWAEVCFVLGRSPQQAYERSIELLPHVIWLGATINSRYDLLTEIGDLAMEAASWAISVQNYDLAIEWLEQGRSIVWNQTLQLRTPLDDLSVHAPALAQRFKDISSQLERTGSRQETLDNQNSTEPDLEKAAQYHRRLAAEWEKCLEAARNLPGFGNFMRPRKAAELKTVATDGPVVVINNCSTRWDALIIFPQCDCIEHLPLLRLSTQDAGAGGSHPQLSIDDLPGHRGERAGGFGRVKNRSNHPDPLKADLAVLWAVVVKPVLDALAYTRKLPVTELPHVTWCATGPLAFAPLHAASAYDSSSPSAFDLVISSYTPSLSALLPRVSTALSDGGVLAIGQDNTKGLPPLPYTIQELEALQSHAQGGSFLRLDGKNATVEVVLGAMEGHGWVHLACHATQHLSNPALSAFHLHDGQLTLEAITRRQFKNKGLAFLSACQTAKGDRKLPDEAVYLAAGMLMAGYPSVIGTMWSIWDVDGPEIAGRVYAELLKDGQMDHRGAARALHKAVAELREKVGENSFERWVPFIHIGV